MYYALMNLLSSHDVERVRSVLSTGASGHDMSREEQAMECIDAGDYELGGHRQKLAALLQFSLPGIPTVYYGDEVGMTGLLDPFNRKTYKVCDEEMLGYYQKIGRIRREYSVLGTGEVCFWSTDGDVLGVLRYDGSDTVLLTVVNPTAEKKCIVVDLHQEVECMSEDDAARFAGADWSKAQSLLSERVVNAQAGLFEIELDAYEGEMFELLGV
jgi:glycosidase